MLNRLTKLVFHIIFYLLVLIFINNPISPLSICTYSQFNGWTWYSIFKVEYLEYYQIIFSLLALLNMVMAIFEFIWFKYKDIYSIMSDFLAIAGFLVIRKIPSHEFAFAEAFLTSYYGVFFWFLNVVIMLIAVSTVLKIFNYLAKGIDHTNSKRE